MPGEKEIDWAAGRTIAPTSVNYQAGFNLARKEVILAALRLIPSEEEMEKFLIQWGQDNYNDILPKQLATTIHTLLIERLK